MPKIEDIDLEVVKPSVNVIAESLQHMTVAINTLVPDPLNARIHSDRNIEAIMDSLKAYGQLKPIVVRRSNNIVLAGNGTLEAAKKLGWTKVAVNYVEMNDIQAAGFGLADNRTSELAQWNYERVNMLATLISEGNGVNVGWTTEDLVALRMMSQKPQFDPDRVPPIPPKAITKVGDLWVLGEHRLLCGDSSSPKDIARLMDGKKAAIMATDPPYGVDFIGQKYTSRSKAWNGIYGDKTQGTKLREWLAVLLNAWNKYILDDSAYYIWTAAMAPGHRAYEAIIDAGLHVQGQVVWVKNHMTLGQADFQWKHEQCWYAFRKGTHHRWYGGRDKTTVWEVKKLANSSYLHPMQKPVELYEYPIQYHTKEDMILAEPFTGSGTQFIAAQKMNRRCYGMEIDPVYCDVTLIRWSEYTGLDPIRVSDKASFKSLRAKV